MSVLPVTAHAVTTKTISAVRGHMVQATKAGAIATMKARADVTTTRTIAATIIRTDVTMTRTITTDAAIPHEAAEVPATIRMNEILAVIIPVATMNVIHAMSSAAPAMAA